MQPPSSRFGANETKPRCSAAVCASGTARSWQISVVSRGATGELAERQAQIGSVTSPHQLQAGLCKSNVRHQDLEDFLWMLPPPDALQTRVSNRATEDLRRSTLEATCCSNDRRPRAFRKAPRFSPWIMASSMAPDGLMSRCCKTRPAT